MKRGYTYAEAMEYVGVTRAQGLRGAFFIGGVAAWVCAHVAILFFGLGGVTPCGSLIRGTAGNGVASR